MSTISISMNVLKVILGINTFTIYKHPIMTIIKNITIILYIFLVTIYANFIHSRIFYYISCWIYLTSAVDDISQIYIKSNEKALFLELVFKLRETYNTYYKFNFAVVNPIWVPSEPNTAISYFNWKFSWYISYVPYVLFIFFGYEMEEEEEWYIRLGHLIFRWYLLTLSFHIAIAMLMRAWRRNNII